MSNFSYLSTHPEYSMFASAAIEAEKVFSPSRRCVRWGVGRRWSWR